MIGIPVSRRNKIDLNALLGGAQYDGNLDHQVSDKVIKWNGGKWTTAHNMRVNRKGHITFLYDQEIYHAGGCECNNCDNEYRLKFLSDSILLLFLRIF